MGPTNQRRRMFPNTLKWIVLAAFVTGCFVIIQSLLYGNIFFQKRAKNEAVLLSAAQKSFENISTTVLQESVAIFENNQDSTAKMIELQTYLRQLATNLEDIAIADRSASLDGVFERFSLLVAITTLLFGGFGVFTGLQYRHNYNEMRAELNMLKQNISDESEAILEKILKRSNEFDASLYAAVDRSSDMIWFLGNSLEHFIHLGAIPSERANKFLNDLYKAGFRFELLSKDQNERLSAIQNLWAQGDCEDLPELKRIWTNENEPEKIRDLAWLAITAILKRCPHDNGHSDLFDQTNYK